MTISKEYSKAYYQKNRTSIRATAKRYYERNKVLKGRGRNPQEPPSREKKMWYVSKSRAKGKNLPFTLSIEDIVIPDICPVLGIPLFCAGGRTNPNSPSIDRLDSQGGYTPDNIHIISWRANKIKTDAKLWELEALVAYMKE